MLVLDPSEIAYVNFNERDVEILALKKFVDQVSADVESFIDVGAHWSWSYYAKQIRALLPFPKSYTAVDVLYCPQTEEIVDQYIVGNVCELEFSKHDLVACVSTIEHSGITTYQVEDYQAEQDKVLLRLLELANKYLFLSFPFGLDDLYPGQYANITNEQLSRWEEYGASRGFQVYSQFWFNEFPQGRLCWNLISRAEASLKPMRPERGTQCIGVIILAR